ncbi:MAG: tail fiber domain-containing protein [Candidatus Omnitrophota bacterium]|jgi:hypothetical protein
MKIFMIVLTFSLTFFRISFAEEEFVVTTYYPSPYGSYYQLTASDRMAIGDVNQDGAVDVRDMAVYPAPYEDSPWVAGDPIPGSLSVAQRIVIGKTTPFLNARLHIHSTHDWPYDVAGIAQSDATPSGWVSQYWLLDRTGTFLEHSFFMNRDRNDQFALVLNYDGEYNGVANHSVPVNDTFAILHGRVAINTWETSGDPDERLCVAGKTNLAGDTNVNGGFTVTGAVQINGNGNVTGTWSAASDARLKKNVKNLSGVLKKIQNINPVAFEWRVDEFPAKKLDEGRQIGIIAQDVEKDFPELVRTDSEGYKALDYNKFTAVLLEAVKEQQKQIEKLEKEIAALKAE